MTSPETQAGALSLEVVADTTGFARDLRAKVNAATERIRARIQAEIDTRGMQRSAQTAARTVEQRVRVRLQVELDTRGLVAAARAAAARASAAATVRMSAQLDETGLRAQARAAAREAAVSVRVDADTTAARNAIRRLKAEGDRTRISVKTDTDTSGGGGLAALGKIGDGSGKLAGLLKFPAIASGISYAASAATSLAGGLLSVVGAGSQALGVLAALPAAIGGAVQVVGALVAGFSGITAAVKAYGKQQQTATFDTQAQARAQANAADAIASAEDRLAQTREEAARRVRDAQEAAAAARRNLGVAEEEAARRVHDAEEQLTAAQRDAKQAQDDLNSARDEARKRLRDLRLELSGAALDEEDAQLAVAQALERLNAIKGSVTSSPLAQREADLAYREALQRLAEVRQRNADLQAEAKDAARRGVEGAANVVQAKQRVVDAAQKERDAEANVAQVRADNARQITDAQRAIVKADQAVRDAQVESARQIVEAERSLAAAQRSAADAMDAQSSAAKKAAGTFGQLGPAGQRFVRFLTDSLFPVLRRTRDSVQAALLPPLQDAIQRSTVLLPVLTTGLSDTGRRLGGIAGQFAALFSSPAFRRDTATIMASNNRALSNFGTASVILFRALADLTVAAGPLIERFSRFTVTASKTIAQFIYARRESGQLGQFFHKAGDEAALLGRIAFNIGRIIIGVFKAATPAGNTLLGVFEKLTKRGADWSNSVTGQRSLAAWFHSQIPVVEEFGRIVLDLGRGLAHLASGGQTAPLLQQIRTQLLPAVFSLAQGMQNSFGPALVTFLTHLATLFGQLGGAGGTLTAFVGTLDTLAGIVSKLLSIPGVQPFIEAFLTLAGTGAALGVVTGWVGKLGEGIGTLGKVTGLTSVVRGFRDVTKASEDGAGIMVKFGAALRTKALPALSSFGTSVLGVARSMGSRIASGLATALPAVGSMFARMGGVVAGGMRAIAGFVAANPWILLVVALAAAVTWVIFHWNTVKRVVGEAVHWVLNFVRHNWPLLVTILGGPLGFVVVQIIKHWQAIKDGFFAAIHWVLNFGRTVWSTLTGILRGPVDTAVGIIKAAIGGLKGIFDAAVKGIKVVWDGLKKVAALPVTFVVNTVIDDWIIGNINKVLGFLHIPKIPEVPRVKFARGGLVPGIGNTDSVDASLTPGEYVLPTRVVDAVGVDNLDRLRAAVGTGGAPPAGPGRRRYKGGGLVLPPDPTVDDVKAALGLPPDASDADLRRALLGYLDRSLSNSDPLARAIGAVTGVVKDAAGKVVDLARSGAANGLNALFTPIRGLLNRIPDAGVLTTALHDAANHIMDSAVAFVRGKESTSVGSIVAKAAATAGNQVGRWAPVVSQVLSLLHQPANLVQWVLKIIQFESGGNPAAINLTDRNARAGDPSRGLMQTIGATFRRWAGPFLSRGIYDGFANIYAGLNYGIHRYGSILNIPGVRSLMHGGPYLPYAAGGMVPGRPSAFDTVRALLRPGEGVLIPEAVDALGGPAAIDALNAGLLRLTSAARRSMQIRAVQRPGLDGATVIVNPRAEHNEEEIGKAAARELEWKASIL